MGLPNDVSANELQLRKLDDRDKLFRAFQLLILAAVVAINIFGLLSIRELAETNRANIEEHRWQVENKANINKAKLDTQLCIISVSPTVRTPEYVKGCYDKVEASAEVEEKLERFGDGQ